jgi:hypothetical protein
MRSQWADLFTAKHPVARVETTEAVLKRLIRPVSDNHDHEKLAAALRISFVGFKRIEKPRRRWDCVACGDDLSNGSPHWNVIAKPYSHYNLVLRVCDKCKPIVEIAKTQRAADTCPYCGGVFSLYIDDSLHVSMIRHLQAHIDEIGSPKASCANIPKPDHNKGERCPDCSKLSGSKISGDSYACYECGFYWTGVKP